MDLALNRFLIVIRSCTNRFASPTRFPRDTCEQQRASCHDLCILSSIAQLLFLKKSPIIERTHGDCRCMQFVFFHGPKVRGDWFLRCEDSRWTRMVGWYFKWDDLAPCLVYCHFVLSFLLFRDGGVNILIPPNNHWSFWKY